MTLTDFKTNHPKAYESNKDKIEALKPGSTIKISWNGEWLEVSV